MASPSGRAAVTIRRAGTPRTASAAFGLIAAMSKGAAAARAAFAASCADRGEKSGSNTGTGPPSTARAVSESGCSR